MEKTLAETLRDGIIEKQMKEEKEREITASMLYSALERRGEIKKRGCGTPPLDDMLADMIEEIKRFPEKRKIQKTLIEFGNPRMNKYFCANWEKIINNSAVGKKVLSFFREQGFKCCFEIDTEAYKFYGSYEHDIFIRIVVEW
ncbi:MAG: hypothetical protein WC473_03440 [Patescibacteria group bacterium]|jgi:hypothetical protein